MGQWDKTAWVGPKGIFRVLDFLLKKENDLFLLTLSDISADISER